ncbi:acyl-CoA dehydrogenase family protein [Georgenia ruanii]|nr:acyl-CoA dehydrogenase family protein [Georgenia ruanii]MPV90564.1 acyl-CoA dehydrogenase [Georgenia ruanii]
MSATSVEDRRLLAESVRAAASGSSPRPLLAEHGAAGTDEALWVTLSQQIGLAGLLAPEDLGGADAGVAEVAAALGELAAQLSPVPALASMGMAGPLLAVTGDGPVRALRARLVEGTPASVAWPHPDGADLTPTLRLEEGMVHGEARFVVDGMAAQVLIAPAAGPDGVVLVALETEAAGVSRTPMTALDITRGLAAVTFDGAPAVTLTAPHPSAEFLRPGLDIALTCLAAEQVGIASRCLDEAVAWAKERVQFDRTIGSFQAIKHTLVDLLQDVELSRSALDIAVAAADAYLEEPTDRTASALNIAASAAKAMCGDAATRVTDETLHIFGGIGFTWEHDAHLYFRRARTLELLLGAPDDHRARLASALGVGR